MLALPWSVVIRRRLAPVVVVRCGSVQTATGKLHEVSPVDPGPGPGPGPGGTHPLWKKNADEPDEETGELGENLPAGGVLLTLHA